MKRQWLFSAISCLLLCFVFLSGTHLIFFLSLFILWFLRMYFLKDGTIIRHVLICSLLFIVFLWFHTNNQFSDLNGEEKKLIIYPELTTIEVDGDYLKFKGKLLSKESSYKENILIKYYLQNEEEKELWENDPPNNFLAVNGELEKPKENTNFYQFNYQDYLKRTRTFWQMNITSYNKVSLSGVKKPLFSLIEEVRTNILNYIDKYFKQPTADYIKILFLADKRSISEEAILGYRVLGILHLFSISGFHISFLAKMIHAFCLKVNISRERSDSLVVLFLFTYGLIVDFGTSVFRTVFQTSILLISKRLKREIDILNAWSITMLLALLLNPYQAYNIAFQLSYVISGGLILLSEQEWIKNLSVQSSLIILSTISFLISMPVLVFHFHEISWITLFSNFLFIPLFSFFLFPFLLSLLLSSIILKETFLFEMLIDLSNQIIEIIESILSYLTNQYDFTFIVGRLPVLIFVVLIICTLKLLINIEQKQKISIVSLTGVLFTLFYHTLSPVGYVLMLDVGQGDSIVIKEPNSQYITMIDTGGKMQWSESELWQKRNTEFSIGENIVVPSLKAFGISKIDRLYITHAHEDHMGEIESIHQSIPINEIAANIDTIKADNFKQKLSNIKKKPAIKKVVPSKVDLPTSDTYILHPIKEYGDKNNQSLVMYVKMGEDSWLFTGDMEKEAENDFIQEYPKFKIDYLKVAHHGSDTSSTENFIKHIQPENAWISVGENNRYNHPSEEILKRFSENETEVNTTAKNGAIIVKYYKIPFIKRWIIKKDTVIKS